MYLPGFPILAQHSGHSTRGLVGPTVALHGLPPAMQPKTQQPSAAPRALSKLTSTQKELLQLVTLGGMAAGQPVPDAAVICRDEGTSRSMSVVEGKKKEKEKKITHWCHQPTQIKRLCWGRCAWG